MDDKFWFLKNCDLFERLSEDQAARLENRARLKQFDRGSLIYLPNDPGDSLLLLASGRVKIYHITSEGKESMLAIIEPGEVFGELSLVDSDQREEFAETMEKSSVILIPRSEVTELMSEVPSVSMGFNQLMGLRRRRIERRLKSLLFRSNRERLIHLLLELTEKYGEQTSEGVQLSIRLSHQELASMIGSTRETVTVLLGEMQVEGSLLIRRRRIILRDLKRLADAIDAHTPDVPAPKPTGTRQSAQTVGSGRQT